MKVYQIKICKMWLLCFTLVKLQFRINRTTQSSISLAATQTSFHVISCFPDEQLCQVPAFLCVGAYHTLIALKPLIAGNIHSPEFHLISLISLQQSFGGLFQFMKEARYLLFNMSFGCNPCIQIQFYLDCNTM